MAKVFISFAQEDNDVAQAVKRLLDRQDAFSEADCFLSSDNSSLGYGENWMERIKKELQACSILVSLLSKRSIGRPWVNF